MATTNIAPPELDARLALLTGETAPELLDAALQQAGGRIVTAIPHDVDHRPGDRTTVLYNATVHWAGGVKDELLGATVGGSTHPGSLVVSDGDHDVQVWRYPHDPELPALPAATYDEGAEQLLRDLGIDPKGLTVNVLTYRPRKRAVIEIVTESARLFVKVLRPSLVRDVDRRHRVLTEAGVPVPRSLGWSDNGLLVLAALPGQPLRDRLATGAAPIGAGDAIAFLDALPHEVTTFPRRKPWAAHVTHYSDVVAEAMPDRAGHIWALGAQIDAGLRDDGDDEPTHGDFYDDQLFVAGNSISGVLDIDTMGPGRRVDDLACAVAHLSVLTTIAPYAPGAQQTLTNWLPVFDRRVDPQQLRLRAAAVMMSLATGPYRLQEPGWTTTTDQRLALVERWITAAENPVSATLGGGNYEPAATQEMDCRGHDRCAWPRNWQCGRRASTQRLGRTERHCQHEDSRQLVSFGEHAGKR